MKAPAIYVGREKELRAGARLVRAGQSLVVEGPFGVGKTSFALRLGSLLEEFKTLHCSLEDDALKIVASLNRQLVPAFRSRGMRLGSHIHYFLKNSAAVKPLIIIDDIWKVTSQKAHFFRSLAANGNCRFIFVSEMKDRAALTFLRTIAGHSVMMTLRRLNPSESRELFLRHVRQTTAIDSGQESLVRSCKGYPLNLIDAARIHARLKER